MSGLVLLDEDERKKLSTRQPASTPRFQIETREFAPVGGSQAPRTDFTSTSATSDPHEPMGRAIDYLGQYVYPQDIPRPDLRGRSNGSEHSGANKPSTVTQTSSVGNGYNDPASVVDRHDDSYPILRDDLMRDSLESVSSQAAAQYAGTSSGLKISIRWIMIGLITGIIVGIVLSEIKVSKNTAAWISLPGDLFLRALNCVVIPYAFCSVAVAVGDIVFVGKVSVIGLQTAKIFMLFWVVTVTVGVAIALLFRPLFRLRILRANGTHSMLFTCPNNHIMTTFENGTIACASSHDTGSTNTTMFALVDTTNYFAKSSPNTIATLTLSDELMQMITPLVSKNLIGSFANGEILSIITFAMVLGAIAGRNYFIKTRQTNYLYLVLLQLRNTFYLMMEWTIWLSPVAVVSIVSGSFAVQHDFLHKFSDVYTYLLAAISAGLVQVLVVYPAIVFFLSHTNPYTTMKHMLRAYMFAFSCSSSLATMPVTLTCVKNSRMCSQSVANFVVSIGVASSISGMGFYTPIAVVFIAEASGNGDMITPLRVVGIFVLGLLSCAGTPPIPASGLVVIATAYTTLFGALPVDVYAYVVSLDFFFDRITTTCNVNDDIMALKIISETTDETVVQNQLGERF